MTLAQVQTWHEQLDELAAAYACNALKRGDPVTIVLRSNAEGGVEKAKISVETAEVERTTRASKA